MRILITVTTDDGNTFQGEAELSALKASKPTQTKKKPSDNHHNSSANVSLSSPVRPFMKKHARGMGGPQKFTLLLAHMAKGNMKTEIPLKAIQKQWGKMKQLLGKWNGAYTIRAKEHEWVDSPNTGMYILLSGWKGIFNG